MAVRRCEFHPFCIHWLHSKDLVNWTQYTRHNSYELGWFGKIWYEGYVKEGDKD